MATPFIGEIRAFGFDFPPKGWAACDGQILPIQQNQALFSLLGTTFGGNGVQTFALPDLRGRIAPGFSSGIPLGQLGGEELHTLSTPEMPQHNHTVNAVNNGTANATNVPAANTILGTSLSSATGNPAVPIYTSTAGNTIAMAPLGNSGGSQAHENRMPMLVTNYCIALQGIFPSRN